MCPDDFASRHSFLDQGDGRAAAEPLKQRPPKVPLHLLAGFARLEFWRPQGSYRRFGQPDARGLLGSLLKGRHEPIRKRDEIPLLSRRAVKLE